MSKNTNVFLGIFVTDFGDLIVKKSKNGEEYPIGPKNSFTYWYDWVKEEQVESLITQAADDISNKKAATLPMILKLSKKLEDLESQVSHLQSYVDRLRNA